MRLPSPAPKTIAQRMVLFIGVATGTVLAVTAGLDYTTSRAALERQTDAEARKEVQVAAVDSPQVRPRTWSERTPASS